MYVTDVSPTKIPVFLCSLFVHFGHCRDFAVDFFHIGTNDHAPPGKTVHSSNNTSGTRVKEFINSLTQNFTKGTFKTRTYARRISRCLSEEQLDVLYNVLPKYLYTKGKLENEKREVVLEVGFGNGEHFIHQATLKPEALHFGVEAYLNGVASALKLALSQEVTNILMFPNDFDYVFGDIPDGILSNVHILFPDPWEKKKQRKKRMVNEGFIRILQTKLNDRGTFVFASDIDEYFYEVVRFITESNNFEILNKEDYSRPPDTYIETKYHEIANAEGKPSKFLICRKVPK